MTEQQTMRRGRTLFVIRVLVIGASAALSACTQPQEARFPRLEITSRVETEPKIVCTNCQCTGDQCFCETCTITADPPPSN